MEKLVQIVGGYRERDKLIRLCQYSAKFLAGTGQTRWGLRLSTIATELGACRTVLRLFDDIPMLAYTLHYGTGRKETNRWLRCLELMSNFANQLYYPLEHIAWFANKKIIDRNPAPWMVACIVAWMVSLITEILKSISRISLIRRAERKLHKETELEARNERESTEMPVTLKSQIRSLKSQALDQHLAVLENIADLVNAINWLPAGYLWAQKFSPKFTGAMGFISSVIKLYRIHASKPKVL